MADVCSKCQCDGDHICAGGLDLTLVVALWCFGRFGVFPLWGLECWPVAVFAVIINIDHRSVQGSMLDFLWPHYGIFKH